MDRNLHSSEVFLKKVMSQTITLSTTVELYKYMNTNQHLPLQRSPNSEHLLSCRKREVFEMQVWALRAELWVNLFLTYKLKSSSVIRSLPRSTSEVKVIELPRKKIQKGHFRYRKDKFLMRRPCASQVLRRRLNIHWFSSTGRGVFATVANYLIRDFLEHR